MGRIYTIWHYAIEFFEREIDLENALLEMDEEPFYKGEIENLSYIEASKIAQIHPSCMKYYQEAMMPLFQGKGKLRSGTEDPVLAIKSLNTKKIDMPYILIWRIFNT